MISAQEIAVAIYGILRLIRLDRGAIQYFDNTEAAFWRSFNAALVAAPAYILLVLLNFADNPPGAGEFRVIAVESITYVVGWVLFPLVMVSFTESAKCFQYYFRFVSAWNWSVVVQVFVFLAITSFGSSGALPGGLAALLSLLATAAVLFYQGYIAHVMLEISPGPAALVVVINLVLDLGLTYVSRWFYG